MKRRIAIWLALCVLLLAGCAKENTDPPAVTVEPAPAAEPAPAKQEAATPDAAKPDADESALISAFHDVKISIPKEYLELLRIETELETWSAHWTPLVSFFHQASMEAYAQDYPDEAFDESGVGWLATVLQLDRIGFEDWLSGEKSGTTLFATDGADRYYLLMQPTDVRVYQPDAAWEVLTSWVYGLPEEIIAQNGFTAYDAHELFDADYTYGGEHVELGYRFPGEPMDLVLLALSQPAKQGEGGVWCVERVRYVYSDYDFTDTHLVFPAALGIEETAADYYARLQGECDALEHPELLTPRGAAVSYARSAAWLFGEDVSSTDFELVESLG